MSDIEGWYKSYRSVFDHWVSTDAEAFLLWHFILGAAAYEPVKKIVLGRLIDLKPGQLLFRGPQLADRLHIDRNKIYRLISLFEHDDMISIQKFGKRYSIITVKNYSIYQGDSLPIEKNRETNNKPKQLELCEVEGLSLHENKKQMRNKRETIYKKEKNTKNKENYIYSSLIQAFTQNDDLIKALEDFISMRKQIKKPLTERAFQLLLKNLSELSNDSNTQIKILEQSILKNWLGVFPLNSTLNSKQPDKPPRRNNFQQREYSDDFYSKLEQIDLIKD